MQSTAHQDSWFLTSILILYSHQDLDLSSCLFHPVFQTNSIWISDVFVRVTSSIHDSLLSMITPVSSGGEQTYKLFPLHSWKQLGLWNLDRSPSITPLVLILLQCLLLVVCISVPLNGSNYYNVLVGTP